MRTTLVLGWRCRQLWRESPFWEQFGLYFTFEAVRVQSIPKPVSNNENDSDNSDNRNTNENSDNTNDNNDNEEYFLGEEQDAWVFVAHKRPINTDEPFNSELKYRVDDQLARLLLARIRI
ncbi:hypothetical protein BDF19DRAFT_438641 [Syncephalis fuscata]|nr:hypothetical protein BDF19DRAFT_438641 [Syncephalis fuscata]